MEDTRHGPNNRGQEKEGGARGCAAAHVKVGAAATSRNGATNASRAGTCSATFALGGKPSGPAPWPQSGQWSRWAKPPGNAGEPVPPLAGVEQTCAQGLAAVFASSACEIVGAKANAKIANKAIQVKALSR